jgi:predicted ABC-type ATPase
MSHPSKVAEIKLMAQLGYKTYLYFVCIDKPEVNISRISNRVSHGGHNVPDKKVLERYVRTLELLPSLLPICYRAYLFDNSGKKNQLIAELYKGDLELKTSNPPQWFIEYVLPHYV